MKITNEHWLVLHDGILSALLLGILISLRLLKVSIVVVLGPPYVLVSLTLYLALSVLSLVMWVANIPFMRTVHVERVMGFLFDELPYAFRRWGRDDSSINYSDDFAFHKAFHC